MARILVVDDDRDILGMVVAALESQGYEVVAVADGLEAEGRLKADRFDLVVTDLKMPKKGGVEVLQAANGLNPKVPVVLISAYGEWSVYLEAMNLGAVDFLNKPVRIADLLRVVARAIRNGAMGGREKPKSV